MHEINVIGGGPEGVGGFVLDHCSDIMTLAAELVLGERTGTGMP